jgi:type II secretory pathway pseudopilin PulG
MGDVGATVRHRNAYKRERGISAIELVATIALMGVVAGVAMPSMTRQPYALWSAQTTLIGDLRQARSESITRGDHYRVDITSAGSYTVSRMQLNADGTWSPRVPAWRTRILPSNVQIVSGAGLGFEFNTRGLMVNPSWAATLVMYDYDKSLTRWVTIWPSGQVAPGS